MQHTGNRYQDLLMRSSGPRAPAGRLTRKHFKCVALLNSGLTEDEVAERYRMTAREVSADAAVESLGCHVFPRLRRTRDPEQPKHSFLLPRIP